MKPKYDIDVELIGQDGNIFNLIGIVSKELKREGVSKEEREEFFAEITQQGSYDEALRTIMDWVNVR